MIGGLHHVAVRTADIERSVEFYSDVLGFEEVMRLHFEDGSYLVQLSHGGSIVELFGGGTLIEEDRGEVGYTHIALQVHSITRAGYGVTVHSS